MRRAAWALGLVLAAGCSFRSPIIPPEPRAVLDTLVPELRALAFSPDGLLLASAGGDDSGGEEITLWTVSTGARKSTFTSLPGTTSALAFSPDSQSIAVGEAEGGIRILDAQTGSERVAFSGRPGPWGTDAMVARPSASSASRWRSAACLDTSRCSAISASVAWPRVFRKARIASRLE